MTDLGATAIALGQSVTDNATVTNLNGSSPVTSGTVDFQVSYNGGSWSTFEAGATLIGGMAVSNMYQPMAAGNYYFKATYSGNSIYMGSHSGLTAEPLTVAPASSIATTELGASSIALGQSVTDNATVIGLSGGFPMPTGTVDFQVSINGGSWTVFDAGVGLIGNSAISAFYIPSVIGEYHFQAVYSGDSNYLSSMSGSEAEPLAVSTPIGVPGISVTTTELSSNGITLGDSVTDMATVAAQDDGAAVPTGSVDFQVSFNEGPWTIYDAGVALVDGTATSTSYAPSAAGDYEFQAVYGGEPNYLGSASGEDDEPLHVSMAAPDINTDLGVTEIILGQSVTDNVTVIGLGDPFMMPTGTVDFQVSYNEGPWSTYDAGVALVDGTATSVYNMPGVPGDYEFQAIYNGDSNYLSVTSGEDTEPLHVDMAASMTTTDLGIATIDVGQSIMDNATVTGIDGFPVPSGTVDFQYSYNGGDWTVYDAGVTLVDGTATSTWFVPAEAGSYNFQAIYNGDGNYYGSMSGASDEPLVVNEICHHHCIILGQSVTDNATVTGRGDGFPMPTGTVDFQFSYEHGDWMTYDAGVVLFDGNATSIWYTPLATGHYNFRAIYSGDSNYNPSMSGDNEEPLCVCPADTTTATILSYDSITFGNSVNDTATVTGLGGLFPVPTGTVDFQYSFNEGHWMVYDAGVALVDGKATSINYLPLTAGDYEFQAVYSGDSNYNPSMSGEDAEPLIVHPGITYVGPTVVTNLGVDSIMMSQSVTDNVTVSVGSPFPMPTGTVDFQVSYNGGPWSTYDAGVALVDGAATSAFYMPGGPGDYEFQANYSGDSNYLWVTSENGSEPLHVDMAPSQTTTCLGTDSIVIGQSVTDNATVTGLDGFPVPTGTVDFQYSYNGGNWMVYDAGVALVDGAATSAFYMPAEVGNYHFQAVYSGDSNYDGSKSCPRSEPLCVEKAPTCTCTWLGVDTIILGQSVTDNVTVTGQFGTPTGTVDFQYSYNGSDWMVYDAGVAVVDGSAISTWNMPMDVGNYQFQAVYSGDGTYLSSMSCPHSEPLCVEKAPTCTCTVLGVDTIILGQSVTDNVTVSGIDGFPVPTGSVDFQVRYEGGSWTVFDANVALVDGTATSAFYMPMAVGNYQFQAVYSGDDNYLGSKSCPLSEPLSVERAPSTTTTILGVDEIVLGQSVRDNATVTGLDGFPVPSGTVDFQVSFNGGAWTTYDAGVALMDGSAISTWYTPHAAGNYTFQAVFSGDSNYLESHSNPLSEPLHVEKAPSNTTTDLGICQPVVVPTLNAKK